MLTDAGPRRICSMSLSRLAWLLTTAVGLLTAVILLISGYKGYAGVSLAVGLSAAINLR
jgi:hypothetical protein